MENNDKHPIKPLTAEFADPAFERAYRVESFPAARRQNRIVCVVVALLVIGHTVSDYLALGNTSLYYVFLAVRLAAASVILMGFPLTASARRYSLSDWGVFLAQAALAVAFVYVISAVPPDVMQKRISVDSMTSILIVMGLYLFVQTRVYLHVIAGVATSAAYLTVSVLSDRLAPEPAVLEGVMHVACNLLGYVAVNQLNRVRRMRFATVKDYREANGLLLVQRRELRELARSREQARDEAIYASRAKSEFIAHMSHELRSPLNAIIGFSEVMIQEVFGRITPPRYREYAGDIHTSGTHLLALINDLLDLSKAEAGRIEINDETITLREIGDSVLRLVIERARKSDLTVDSAIPDNLPALRADRRLMKQMTLNLVTNAIKFTDPGGTVRLGADRGRDGGLRLWVADTGVGIAAADVPSILEPYGQVRAENGPRETEGTGLGLALVKKMVEMHGGRLEIESAPGKGSTFTLCFPPERTVNEDDAGAAADTDAQRDPPADDGRPPSASVA